MDDYLHRVLDRLERKATICIWLVGLLLVEQVGFAIWDVWHAH